MEDCQFCKSRKCEGCPLPYTDKLKYEELLRRLGIKGNESYFSENYSSRGRNEIVLELSLAQNLGKEIFEPFT